MLLWQYSATPPGFTRFPPCFKLRLAWQYQVEDWLDECIMDIIALPPLVLDRDDHRDLEEDVIVALNTCHESVRQHRMELIPYIPEPKHVAECKDRGRCARDWTTSYASAMLLFAHTRHYYSGREVFDKLKTIEVHTVHDACRKLTLADIEKRCVLWKEEVILEEGKAKIRSLLLNSRPMHPRPPVRLVDQSSLRCRDSFYVV